MVTLRRRMVFLPPSTEAVHRVEDAGSLRYRPLRSTFDRTGRRSEGRVRRMGRLTEPAEEGLLTYGEYLAVPELIGLQRLRSNPPVHDGLPVHRRPSGVRAVVQAVDLRARIGPRPTVRGRRRTRAPLPHADPRDRARPDRPHPGPRDDDAAGLPRVPLAAHAGLGVPVGPVPGDRVPLGSQAARVPPRSRGLTRRASNGSRAGWTSRRSGTGSSRCSNAMGCRCPRTTRTRGARACCGWPARPSTPRCSPSAERLVDHDEGFAQWRYSPRADGRTRDRRQVRDRGFVRRGVPALDADQAVLPGAPGSPLAPVAGYSCPVRGRSGGTRRPSLESSISVVQASLPGLRLLRARHPVHGRGVR